MDDLKTLADYSRRLGEDRALVQGAGGNTSLKDGPVRMWIKASGLALVDVTPETGFVAVAYPSICADVGGLTQESAYTALIQASIIKNKCESIPLRPSLETGFHALLGRAVLHSHSVWTNILSCAANGQGLAKQLFPKCLWVPYAAPGLPLTQAIAARLQSPSETSVLLLQNHGLVVSSPTLDCAWAIQEEMGKKVCAHFGLAGDYSKSTAPSPADESHVLFPDQAVYLLHEALKTSVAGAETLQAYSFIRQTLEELGLTPHYLAPKDVQFLLDMEAEKYRQKVARA